MLSVVAMTGLQSVCPWAEGSDADGLVGCGCDRDPEVVADLKIAAGPAGIDQTCAGKLGRGGNNS